MPEKKRLTITKVTPLGKEAGEVNAQAVYPNEALLWNGTHAFLGTTVWPESQARLKRLIELGFMQPGDMEMNMGERLGRGEDFAESRLARKTR